MVQKITSILFTALILFSCKENQKQLPILGERFYDAELKDTVYHTIDKILLEDKNGQRFDYSKMEGKPYVADFFFTSCPSMCPIMATQMKRIQSKVGNKINLLSISIDYKRDTPERMQHYIEKSHIDTTNWFFLRGTKEQLSEIGEYGFFTAFGEDEAAPGGYYHASYFYLIDTKKRIRGIYDGMVEEDVDKLINDIEILLNE
ncbi:MAG: SCO family protein [Bacteroidia bacterium]